MSEEINMSPDPKIVNGEFEDVKYMNFFDALHKVFEGQKISKKEWGSTDSYGELRDGILRLHKDDGKFYNWIISDGDISGEDWFTL